MYHEDTSQLLKECNSGIKMAVDAIQEVLPNVKNQELRTTLATSEREHSRLGDETHSLLVQNRQQDKEPSIMAKGMSWMKTNVKMTVTPGDDTIADLISAGCDMGVRTLYKCLNKCQNASEHAKSLVKRVIKLEEDLSANMRAYL